MTRSRALLLLEALPEDARVDEADAIAQARVFEAALDELGYDTDRLAIDLDLAYALDELRARAPDLVVNLAESLGRSGRFAHFPTGILEASGIPFTGCGDAAMVLTSNKPLAKRFLRALGLPSLPSWSLAALESNPTIEPGDYIVKSTFEEGSVGLDEDSVVHVETTAELRAAIVHRLPQSMGDAFAEPYIEGREFNLAVLDGAASATGSGGPIALPPAEIEFDGYPPGKRRVVGYRAKWDESSFEYRHTKRTFDFPAGDAPLLARLSRLALDCWTALDLSGYARVDFRVDAVGRPFILEINANPCISANAGVMAAATRAGLTAKDVVARIVAAALARKGRS